MEVQNKKVEKIDVKTEKLDLGKSNQKLSIEYQNKRISVDILKRVNRNRLAKSFRAILVKHFPIEESDTLKFKNKETSKYYNIDEVIELNIQNNRCLSFTLLIIPYNDNDNDSTIKNNTSEQLFSSAISLKIHQLEEHYKKYKIQVMGRSKYKENCMAIFFNNTILKNFFFEFEYKDFEESELNFIFEKYYIIILNTKKCLPGVIMIKIESFDVEELDNKIFECIMLHNGNPGLLKEKANCFIDYVKVTYKNWLNKKHDLPLASFIKLNVEELEALEKELREKGKDINFFFLLMFVTKFYFNSVEETTEKDEIDNSVTDNRSNPFSFKQKECKREVRHEQNSISAFGSPKGESTKNKRKKSLERNYDTAGMNILSIKNKIIRTLSQPSSKIPLEKDESFSKQRNYDLVPFNCLTYIPPSLKPKSSKNKKKTEVFTFQTLIGKKKPSLKTFDQKPNELIKENLISSEDLSIKVIEEGEERWKGSISDIENLSPKTNRSANKYHSNNELRLKVVETDQKDNNKTSTVNNMENYYSQPKKHQRKRESEHIKINNKVKADVKRRKFNSLPIGRESLNNKLNEKQNLLAANLTQLIESNSLIKNSNKISCKQETEQAISEENSNVINFPKSISKMKKTPEKVEEAGTTNHNTSDIVNKHTPKRWSHFKYRDISETSINEGKSDKLLKNRPSISALSTNKKNTSVLSKKSVFKNMTIKTDMGVRNEANNKSFCITPQSFRSIFFKNKSEVMLEVKKNRFNQIEYQNFVRNEYLKKRQFYRRLEVVLKDESEPLVVNNKTKKTVSNFIKNLRNANLITKKTPNEDKEKLIYNFCMLVEMNTKEAVALTHLKTGAIRPVMQVIRNLNLYKHKTVESSLNEYFKLKQANFDFFKTALRFLASNLLMENNTNYYILHYLFIIKDPCLMGALELLCFDKNIIEFNETINMIVRHLNKHKNLLYNTYLIEYLVAIQTAICDKICIYLSANMIEKIDKLTEKGDFKILCIYGKFLNGKLTKREMINDIVNYIETLDIKTDGLTRNDKEIIHKLTLMMPLEEKEYFAAKFAIGLLKKDLKNTLMDLRDFYVKKKNYYEFNFKN